MKLITILILVTRFTQLVYSQTTLSVEVTGLEDNRGQVVLLLFKEGQNFGIKEKPFKRLTNKEINNKTVTFEISNLEKGEYAFLVFHDADANGVFATNWLGMPKEGIAKSGVQGKRPTYRNSKFLVTDKKLTFITQLKYIL